MRVIDLVMSKTEVKPRTVRVTELKSGETVESATATHTPPAGGSPLTITPAVSSPNVTLSLGPFVLAGLHHVKVQAVGSDGSKPEILYNIEVKDA